MTSGPRVLVCAQTGNGLGHLRRVTTIANALTATRPEISVLVVTDSPVASFFELRGRADLLRLPQLIKADTGAYVPGRLRTQRDVVNAVWASVLRETAARFAPDLVLVDHLPGGPNGEFVPMLETVRDAGGKLALGLRDVTDDPAVVDSLWRRDRTNELIRDYFDRVLVYGTAGTTTAALGTRLPGIVGARIVHCGYVCDRDGIPDPTSVRRGLTHDGEQLVVGVGGGGWDAYELLSTFVDAVGTLRTKQPLAGVVVTGPLMPDAEHRRLCERAGEVGVCVRRSVSDARPYFHAADLVVSKAGYNTLVEVVAAGARTIVVPRPGPSAEQRIRSELFSRRGLIDVLEPVGLSPERLAGAIENAIASRWTQPPEALPLDGLDRATEVLLGLIGERTHTLAAMKG